MTPQELSPEQIEQNWNKFRSFFEKLGDRAPAAIKMMDALEERLALAPASGRTSFHNSFPGGLVDHSLRVLGNAIRLCKTFGWEFDRESLIIGCLLHDLGKVGDEKHDYYVPQDSDWHREKLGENYKINDQIAYMTVPDRGVYLCQHFGLTLKHDEMLAILLNDGQYADENKPYRLREPALADVVHMADLIATKQEKGMLPS